VPISPDFRKGGSEQIREGARISKKPPTHRVERFLSMLSSIQGKSECFGYTIDPEVRKFGL
jgi:hypothetical protein